jgi:hypothetical protein
MWHQGYVNVGGRWVETDKPVAELLTNLEEYERLRAQSADTVQGQVQLADWCRDRRLGDQARAHLTRVIELDPHHVEARQRLGFRPIRGDWVSQAEFEQAQRAAERQRQWLAGEEDVLEEIKRLLTHPSARRRELGASRLAAIKEPEAFRPLERMIAADSPQAASHWVESLSNLDTHAATLALARQAVLARWSEVRQQAIRALRSRDSEDYVPELLAAMYTPVTARTVAVRAPGGDVMFRQSLRREGRDQQEELVLDSRFGAAVERSDIARENYRTEWLNERIGAVLNLATDQNLPAAPETWWQWWNDKHEVYVEGEKPLHSVRPNEQLARIERFRELEDRQAREAAQRSGRRCDCLAAGTAVWTVRGPVAVEEVQIGDLVLAQDVETGELAYKPVLQTTVRPSSTLVRIQCGEQTLQASGGHPFWVAGEGWIKARDLASGMELHTLAGPLRVSLVEDGDAAESYNLVVADFSSYFIGAERVLTHDNTIRRPTDAVVPGLSP